MLIYMFLEILIKKNGFLINLFYNDFFYILRLFYDLNLNFS